MTKDNYYLVDDGDTNKEWFLAPFIGQIYHLNIWLNGQKPEKEACCGHALCAQLEFLI